MQLILDGDKYGFISGKRSSISFEINGACLNPYECDIFFGFGDMDKYLLIIIAMDEGGYTADINNQISAGLWMYPSCGTSSIPSADITQVFNTSLSTRDNLGGGNYTNLYSWSDEKDVIWPINVAIINDDRTNQVIVSLSNGDRSASCSFDDTFTANTDLYMTLKSDGGGGTFEGFDVFDIMIEKDDGSITALDNDPLVTITTATPPIIDTSTPYWHLNNTKDTDPPSWYVDIVHHIFVFL